MSTKIARRARRERKRAADQAATAAALSIPCPVCKAAPTVWCGPVLAHAVFRPITPWMHEQRYRISTKES